MTHISTAGRSLVAALVLVVLGLVPMANPQLASAAGSIHLNITTMGPGTRITVTGSGYTPGSSVLVYSDVHTSTGTKRVQSSALVAANGTFSTQVTVPTNTTPGRYTLTATDLRGISAAQPFDVLAVVALRAGAQAGPITVAPGNSFFVNGSGFQPGETVRVVVQFPTYGGNPITESKDIVANANGDFAGLLFAAPRNAQAGTFTATGTGTKSGKSSSGKITVVYSPQIALSTSSARPGDTVTVTGSGFAPDSMVRAMVNVPLTSGALQLVYRDVRADARGAISAALPLPGDARPGAYTVSAAPTTGGFQATAKLLINFKPTISLNPASTAPGADVVVTGSGFSPNATIRVAVDIPTSAGNVRTIFRDVKTNGNGQLSATLPLPTDTKPGTYSVTARDTSGHVLGQARVLVSVNAVIAVSPAALNPGGRATVTGHGYAHNAAITVTATFPLFGGGSQPVTVRATTNGAGAFSVGIPVPSRAAAGRVTVTAQGPSARSSTQLTVNAVNAQISVSPASIIPGGTLTVTGGGFPANDTVLVSVPVTLTNGQAKTLSATATANAQGQVSVHLTVPADAAGGAFTITARSASTGRTPSTHFSVAVLAPSLVATPVNVTPGTSVSIHGFGFAANERVTIKLNDQQAATATTDASGQFSASFTASTTLAAGSYTLSASSTSGRNAHFALTVSRQVSTHFYFASVYTGTGYHEYLTFLNPTETRAAATITYMLKSGQSVNKALTVNAHSRATQDMNADLGPKVSASAAVSADVAIAVERLVYHQRDNAIDPGATAPATQWFFANGNTSSKYREYIAIQNPGTGPVQVSIHFFPTHHRAFTINKTMQATSRLTVKVNSYVKKDAVGIELTANGPVVANRTIFIKDGMDSKTGVTAPQTTWYFAAGPRNAAAKYWIGLINPLGSATRVTLHAYSTSGQEIGTATGTVPAYGRAGYLINKIAGRTDAAVVVTSSGPTVVEQMTYLGKRHSQSEDSFGVPAAFKTWNFAAVNTSNGDNDALALFNPNLVPIPVVVQFMTSTGATATRTYVIGPLAHQYVDVGSVQPNANLGIVAASNDTFVALNWYISLGGSAGTASTGHHS